MNQDWSLEEYLAAENEELQCQSKKKDESSETVMDKIHSYAQIIKENVSIANFLVLLISYRQRRFLDENRVAMKRKKIKKIFKPL